MISGSSQTLWAGTGPQGPVLTPDIRRRDPGGGSGPWDPVPIPKMGAEVRLFYEIFKFLVPVLAYN